MIKKKAWVGYVVVICHKLKFFSKMFLLPMLWAGGAVFVCRREREGQEEEKGQSIP